MTPHHMSGLEEMVSTQRRIVEITTDNIDDHPQVICFINPKHKLYNLKKEWILEQLKNGLKIKVSANPLLDYFVY